MNAQVHFMESSSIANLTDGTLGTFDMGAVPDVGETVELQGDDYIVIARRWTPKKFLAHVSVTVRKA
jgi:hypothetical protein